MIYGYARVSTRGQAVGGFSLEDQEQKLREAGAVTIFTDAFTGTKIERPEFDKLKSVLQSGDTVIVTKLDRIARSSAEGSMLVKSWIDSGVRVHILNMGMIDNTPTGRLIMNIMFAFAEFERDMIVQRTQEGKAIAKQKEGFKDGRPEKFTNNQRELALSLLNSGHTYKEVVELTGLSKSTIIRYKRETEAKQIMKDAE